MTLAGFLAVGLGAAIGAWLRWWLGIALNPILPNLPLGTFCANLIGGYLMGVALALIVEHDALSPEMRLLLTTGFLGGLTTFSTFSGEATGLLMRSEYVWACALILGHVAGSIAMTFAGFGTMRLVLR